MASSKKKSKSKAESGPRSQQVHVTKVEAYKSIGRGAAKLANDEAFNQDFARLREAKPPAESVIQDIKARMSEAADTMKKVLRESAARGYQMTAPETMAANNRAMGELLSGPASAYYSTGAPLASWAPSGYFGTADDRLMKAYLQYPGESDDRPDTFQMFGGYSPNEIAVVRGQLHIMKESLTPGENDATRAALSEAIMMLTNYSDAQSEKYNKAETQRVNSIISRAEVAAYESGVEFEKNRAKEGRRGNRKR